MSARSKIPFLANERSSRPALAVDGDDSGIRALSDPDLLVLISLGRLDALGAIYDRHIEVAWRVALHVSANAAAAEQAVSDAFLQLWRNPEPNDRTSLSARLLSSVSRIARASQQVPKGQRMTTNSEARSMMAAVNESIDRVHSSLDLADSDFFCECGHIGCKERITLSRCEYASQLEESRPLVVAAHADRDDAAATELHELRGQVHQLQGTLASRVNIEQAKGVLVERHGVTPDAAFEALRQQARDQRRSLDEVCAEFISDAGSSDVERSSGVGERRGR